MKTREEALEYGLSFPDTYRDAPFHDNNWILVRCKGNGKAFLWTYEFNGNIQINLKVDPEWRDVWISMYDAVKPAYHMNKRHWITIVLDGSMPDEEVRRFIGESYALVVENPKAGPRTYTLDEVERELGLSAEDYMYYESNGH